MTGMIGGFFGFETSFDSVFFGGGWGEGRVGRFGKHFFGWLDLSREFLGYSKQSEDLWYCQRIPAAFVCELRQLIINF